MIERRMRWFLVGVTVCWILIAISNLAVGDLDRWYPDITGIFSIACAACTATLAYRPANEIAYRYGGALAVGTLVLRAATAIAGEVQAESSDYFWLFLAQVAITLLLAGLYANWWLVDVKAWHRVHRLAER